MVIAADFSGLHAWAQALAVILLLELIVLLIVVAALTLLLMLGARWLQRHVIPLLNATVPRAKQALDLTNQGTDRVVRGVAEVHGWRSGLEAGLKVLFQANNEPGVAQEPPLGGGAPGAAMPPPTSASAPDVARPGAPAAPGSRPIAARPDEPVRWQGDQMPPPAAHAG
ncbi:MAG TPA: hypothetical protein VIG30_06415 [Ktedonobacterales bacterium]|jgi:hypothetical protein